MSFTAIITANIKDFENNLNRAAKKTDDFERGIDNNLSDAENSFKDFGLKVGGIIAGVFAIEKITAFTSEIMNLGGQMEGVREAFESFAPTNTMRELQRATRGTVNELELMQRAVMAQNFGIPIENLSKLLEFATKRAQQTGQSVDYLVDSIVTGIGRKSILILDNLGISATMLRDRLGEVGIESADVASYAAAVMDIANESLEKSGTVTETYNIKIQALKAAWDDLKISIGEAIVANNDGLNNSISWLSNQIKLIGNDVPNIIEMIFGGENKRYKESMNDINKSLEDFLNTTKKVSTETVPAIEQAEKTIGDLKTEIDTLKSSIDGYGVSQTSEIQKTLQQIAANEELIKSLTTLKTATNNITRVATPDGMDSIPTGTLFNPESFKIEPVLEVDKLMAGLKTIKDETKTIMIELGDVVTSAIDEFAYAIGEGLGGDWSNLGLSLLKAVGNIAQQFGAFMISMGVAALQLETLIANPLTAIAAGAALVAMGAMIGGAAQSMIDSNISGSSGGGYSTSTYSSPVYSERQGAYAVEFKIKKGDLAAVLEMDNNQKNRIQ